MKYLMPILTVFVFFAIPMAVLGQPGGEPAPVPIDGGASILAAAGIAYGVKKYRDMRKQGE
jgi:hypothetical protein